MLAGSDFGAFPGRLTGEAGKDKAGQGRTDPSSAKGVRRVCLVVDPINHRNCFKPKNSAAVPPSKLLMSCLLSPSLDCSIVTVLGKVPSG